MNVTAAKLHQSSIVIDGLTYHYFGPSAYANAREVTATNLTLSDVDADFGQVVKDIGHLRERVRCDPTVVVVESVEEILKAKSQSKVGLIIGFQHSAFLETDLPRVDVLRRLGMRVLQLTYMERTFAGDGCLEPRDGGLSEFGKDLIHRLSAAGVTIDLSHASWRTAVEAAQESKKPVIISHSNPYGLTANPRNVPDEVIREIADRGGVVGATAWCPLCWKNEPRRPSVEDYLDHVEYMIKLVGVDHVAIATDSPFIEDVGVETRHSNDGQKRWPSVVAPYRREVCGDNNERYQVEKWLEELPGVQSLHVVTEGLLRRDYSSKDIAKVLGGNLLRVFEETWQA